MSGPLGRGRALDDVVAKRVEHELARRGDDPLYDGLSLLLRRVVEAALEHAAAVAVRRDAHRLGAHGVIDEARAVGGEGREAALHDVVAVHVEDELHHARPHRADERVELRLRVRHLDHLLDDARAVDVEGDRDELGARAAHEGHALLGRAVPAEIQPRYR